MNKIVKAIDQTFLVGIGTMIGFMAANLIKGPQFSIISWSAITAITAAMVTIFIDFVIQPNQIFGFWTTFLERVVKNPMNPFRFMYKPMGGCLYCMNVWVTLAAFLVAKNAIGMSWWYLIPVVSISHVVLAIVERKVNA